MSLTDVVPPHFVSYPSFALLISFPVALQRPRGREVRPPEPVLKAYVCKAVKDVSVPPVRDNGLVLPENPVSMSVVAPQSDVG